MYSLDVRNKMQPSRFSSPRKQTFHLAVGSNASPQKIRVTVETEDGTPDLANAGDGLNDDVDFGVEQKVSRRLFTTTATTSTATPTAASSSAFSSSLLLPPGTTTSTSSRRRRRSPSPAKPSSAAGNSRKRARLSTTTTKVPLRGLSDDEDAAGNGTTVSATPMPKRGRPRRSGTPKPATTTTIEPSSPRAASPATVNAPSSSSSPAKRGRKPRAATPKAEEGSGVDELASVDATPAMSTPSKRTPGAGRVTRSASKTKGTPKAASSTPIRSGARRVTRRTPRKTPKGPASSAFSGSDAESIKGSVPTKRGRGRPRRQAMAPDEMAVIVEHELEEQQDQTAAAGAAVSASPDPIMDEDNDAIDAQPFHAPTPLSTRRLRAVVSPAPTSLSSVDLISVQTPARPNFETGTASARDSDDDEAVVQATALERANEEVDENSGDDFAYGAPSAEDYFSDNGVQDYDVPDAFVDTHTAETSEANATAQDQDQDQEATSPPPAPVTGSVHDDDDDDDNDNDNDNDELQTPQLPRFAESSLSLSLALAETTNVAEEPVQPAQPATDEANAAAAYQEDNSEDELAPFITRSDAVELYNDRPIYSEELHATTPQIQNARAISPDADAESSPMVEAPTLTIVGIQHQAAEASNNAPSPSAAVVDREKHEAVATSSPVSRRRDHSDMLHFNVDSPDVQEASTSHSHREPQPAQSELTAPDSDSDGDGDVDAVLSGSADDQYLESEAESAVVMDGVTKTNFRDMDTIAQGEEFSMIGVESLQASFQMSHGPMPAMGEMTSRIVNRSLQSVRQGSLHGHQDTENRDNDGLSYLDFLYESSSPTPASASHPTTIAVSASKTPQTPKAVGTPSRENDATVPQSLPAPKSDSPRKKAEPLREFIARKSLHEAHGSAATSRVLVAAASPEPSHVASSPQSQAYDDSFSEIPDYVLEAVVPEATNTNIPFFSRHQAELTGQVAVEPVADDASAYSSELRHADSRNPMDAAAEDGEHVAQATQHEAEITSSPPVQFSRTQRAVSEQAASGITQRPRLATGNRTTPVGIQSPHYPLTSGSNDHLRVPSEGFRPSLSPIVRAGRALQSVTSDPPTPKENEGFLRSPFRSSVARDTQSPAAAAHGRDSSSPDPVPPTDESPIHDQLLREQDSVVDASTIDTGHDGGEVQDEVQDEFEQVGEAVEEASQEETNAPAETAPSQQPQPSPPSITRAAWDMAMAPFSGIKKLVITASQASPLKRTASEAQLDTEQNIERGTEPQETSADPTPRSVKRLRMETPSRVQDTQPGSGSDTGTGRTWRSYLFRENGVAGSITSFASKLVSRNSPSPVNNDGENANESFAENAAGEESDDQDVDDQEEPDDEAAPATHNETVNAVVLPEARAMMDSSRRRAPVLASEANSTQYGSDVIMSMINDISGEGQDVDAGAGIDDDQDDQDEQGNQDTSEDELSPMTPAVLPSPRQQQQQPPNEEVLLEAENEEEGEDDDDIWFIEADRTQRNPLKGQERLPTARLIARTSTTPVRNPRLARIQSSGTRRSLGSSPLTQNQSLSQGRDGGADKSGPASSSASKANSPRPTGRFLLDDFFSSPMVLPKLLPPTSEQNIRFNEESRRKAVDQNLEHERRREARDAARATPGAVVPRTSEQSPKQSPEQEYEYSAVDAISPAAAAPAASTLPSMLDTRSNPLVMSDREWEEMLKHGRARIESRRTMSEDGGFHMPGEDDRTIIYMLVNEKYDAIERELEEELRVAAAQRKGDERRAEDEQLERERLRKLEHEAQAQREHARKLERDRDAQRKLDAEREAQRQAERQQRMERERQEAARRLEAEHEAERHREIETTRKLEAERNAERQREIERDREMKRRAAEERRRQLEEEEAAAAAEEEALRVRLADEAEFASRQYTPQLTTVQQEGMDVDAEDAEDGEAQQQDTTPRGAFSFSYEDEDTSYLDESSFVTPILKPLPDKTASPTKSCIRPMTKPKTPGRVVEFTSSTMAGARDEILQERENLDNASLLFAEHFGLDTDNRLPIPALAPVPLNNNSNNNSNTQPQSVDGDVRMWDRKEVTEELAAIEQNRRQNRPYEVDQQVSDMMLSDTHEISAPRPFQQVPRPNILASTSGRPLFFSTQSVRHAHWQPPAAIEQPPSRDWQLDDWLLLNAVLQTYRREGPLNFSLNYMPAQFRHQHTPRRMYNDAPEPERPSSLLLNKIVHTRELAMLVKSWHIDIVDVFMARSGYTWNEHYLMRRLFSLLMGEQRRGVFRY
ncbi:hypothetical protein SCUCBS95973_007704 [Sporothrix curviconia]|uniref:Involucrin repeat protein n=1 Tax=Sporothrix curviconia TaxID=1260050 RepID=A0ABP0CFJ2_9PEZI